jgi:hypothetical protein
MALRVLHASRAIKVKEIAENLGLACKISLTDTSAFT